MKNKVLLNEIKATKAVAFYIGEIKMKIHINSSSVKYYTGKAYLIAIPRDVHEFWLPDSKCYPAHYSAGYVIYLNEDFDYYLTKKKSRSRLGSISGYDLIRKFDKYQCLEATGEVEGVEHHKPDKVNKLDKVIVDKDLLR